MRASKRVSERASESLARGLQLRTMRLVLLAFTASAQGTQAEANGERHSLASTPKRDTARLVSSPHHCVLAATPQGRPTLFRFIFNSWPYTAWHRQINL